MFAILDGLKTRVSNLTARHEAEEAAGDDAAAARTAEEVQSLVDAAEEIVKNVEKQPTCQLTLEVSAFGTLVMTMNQGKLSESLMSLCTAFLRHLGKEKGEGKDVGPQILVPRRAHGALEEGTRGEGPESAGAGEGEGACGEEEEGGRAAARAGRAGSGRARRSGARRGRARGGRAGGGRRGARARARARRRDRGGVRGGVRGGRRRAAGGHRQCTSGRRRLDRRPVAARAARAGRRR